MYIATKDVNTAFGTFKKGELTNDKIGAQYSAFKKVEEVKEVEAPKEVKPAKKAKKKKEEPKEEILTEVSDAVEVIVEEE